MEYEIKVMYATLPFVLMVGVFAVLAYAVSRRTRLRELAHRERLAMIEKGLMPPPETWTPAMLEELDPDHRASASRPGGPAVAAMRYRAVGVVITAIGLGLTLIIGLAAGQPRIGLGVGGAIALLGLALVVNSYVLPPAASGRLDSTEPAPRRGPPPAPGGGAVAP